MEKRLCLPSRISSYAFSPVSTPDNERGRMWKKMSNSVRERKSVKMCGRFHSMTVLVNINWNAKQSKQTWNESREHIFTMTPDPQSLNDLSFSYTAITGTIFIFLFWSVRPENKLGAIRFHSSLILSASVEKKKEALYRISNCKQWDRRWKLAVLRSVPDPVKAAWALNLRCSVKACNQTGVNGILQPFRSVGGDEFVCAALKMGQSRWLSLSVTSALMNAD